MIIREEFFTNKETGKQMKTTYFGTSEDNITSTVTVGVPTEEDEVEEISEPVQILSETEEAILNTNINVEYLVALQELNL
jgi:hypothetical protein